MADAQYVSITFHGKDGIEGERIATRRIIPAAPATADIFELQCAERTAPDAFQKKQAYKTLEGALYAFEARQYWFSHQRWRVIRAATGEVLAR